MKLTSDVKQRKQRSQHNNPNPNNSYKTKKKFTGSYTEVNPKNLLKTKMSFRLSVYSLRRIKMKRGMTKYMQKRRTENNKKNYKKNYKSKVSTCKLGSYCLRRMLYWLGIGFELLSACLVAEVCQRCVNYHIEFGRQSATITTSFQGSRPRGQ